MCSDADAKVSQYIQFEGDADAKGVLKLVGASISGSITIEKFENLEQQLNDFRTNPTVCQFEAFKLLRDIFETRTENYGQAWCSNSRLNDTEQTICDNQSLRLLDSQLVATNGKEQRLSAKTVDRTARPLPN